MKIGVISLGCAKNLVDTENLLGLLSASNQTITTEYNDADAIVINTCGFIESAKVEAIQTILEAADYKAKGVKKLIVMGCLAQRYKVDLEQEMPEVDRFIAIDEYGNLGTILSEVLGEKIANNYGKAPRLLSGKPWMAYLRIADGCDNRCSYCAIPLIRGNLRSFAEEELVEEAKRLVSGGVKELTLIAQDSSRYGYDWDKKLHLSSLLKKLDEIDGVKWIRILYLYPDEIPDDLIATMKESKHILPYFDIPIQHGSDRMLRRMHRRSNAAEILERTTTIRKQLPNAVLRTTLMTGFPGETLADHEQNINLMKQVKWDHLGVFTYSKEEGTSSYDMIDDVSEEEKERRKQEIMSIQDQIVEQARHSLLNQKVEVLIESKEALTGMYIGRSVLFAPDGVDGLVRVKSEQELQIGEIYQAVYTKVLGQNMLAQII